MSLNSIKPEGLADFFGFLMPSQGATAMHLAELNISGNFLGDAAGVLAGWLEEGHVLRSLDASKTRMSLADAVPLLRALRGASSLTRLDIGGNELGDKLADALGGAIGGGYDGQLVDLSINSAGLGESGCLSIAALLADGSVRLKRLSLEGNSAGERGARGMAEALVAGGGRLEELWFGYNEVRDWASLDGR